MDRTERFYRIDDLIRQHDVVSFATLLADLGVSRATLKRDLEYLRSRLHAPIEYDRDNNGYRFAAGRGGTGPRYQLPGLWFNASEIHALLTMRHLLKGLEPGILAPHVEPLMARLMAILEPPPGAGGQRPERPSLKEIEDRIRIVRLAARPMKLEFFELAATATLGRQRLAITFWSRHSNETTQRVVSPQRLVFYRGNWYLDAWCHLREGIRSFALDGIRAARTDGNRARAVAKKDLDDYLAASYGIFGGPAKAWARLRFTPEAARWVAHERWHSQQRIRYDSDGSFLLEVPVGDDRELVMDILKYGPACRVEAPEGLRAKVASAARETAALYG